MKQIIVIPARMGGSRLPGKPLIHILGKPMIHHVFERCIQIHDMNKVYIATEDESIEEYCSKNKMNCINTGPATSAIDRLKLFSDKITADSYINVQGDEPIVNILDIKTILDYNKQYPDRVVFGKTSANENEFNDYSKAKVVCDLNGKLIYSSRAGIPISNKGKFVQAERAIWIYAFHKSALDAYHYYQGKTKIDQIEDNEIIRFLEIGIPVYCTDLIGDSWAVDEEKDIKVVEELLGQRL
jgi:3-deoxy-manno-octulosonate cytidylyltransferase (CMP-KDO synthetase)